MNIIGISANSYNNNYYQPYFQGHSRNLQSAIDSVIIHKEINDAEKRFLIDKIKKALPTMLVPQKFLGLGTHKYVFSITRKYAARVSDYKIKAEDLGDNLQIGQGVFKNITNYFGEAIVELGDLQILKNIGKHTTAGIPEHKVPFMTLQEQKKYYLTKYLPKFADIPQFAYDDLAKNISKINNIQLGERQYCVFDSLNPNNIVEKGSRFFIVDEMEKLYDKPYGNTTAKLFEVLINRMHKSQDSPISQEHTKLYRKIFKKIILAVEKNDIIHAETKHDYQNWEKALERCQIKNPAYTIIDTLEQIHAENIDVNERNLKIKNYLNKIFVENSSF